MNYSSVARRFLPLAIMFGLFFSPTVTWANEKVTYVGPANLSIAPIVALEKGYFADEGLDVDFQTVQTGKLAMEAVMSGRADFGSIVETNVAYAGFQSNDLRIVASYGLDLGDAVIFPADSPIQTAHDLKGKKIGFAPSTTSQDFLIRLLDKNGLTWADITPVSLQPPTLLAALKGGQVDAVVTWQPWRTSISKGLDGAVREIVTTKDIYPHQDFCASTSGYLAKHPDVPAKLLRALIKGETYANAHPEETAQIIAQKMGQDIEAVRTFIIPVHININDSIIPLVTDYAAWVVKNQEEFLNKPLPDYTQDLAPEYLKSVAPDRVGKSM